MTLVKKQVKEIVEQIKVMDWDDIEGPPELVEHYRRLLRGFEAATDYLERSERYK